MGLFGKNQKKIIEDLHRKSEDHCKEITKEIEDLSEIINDLVFGEVIFDESLESWTSTKYIETISKEITIVLELGKEIKIPDNFKKIFINFWDNYQNIEPELANAIAGEPYQFLRKGYFCLDENSTKGKLIFNRTVGLKDTWAKEMKKK